MASGLVDIIDNNKDKRDISIEGILVRDVKKHAHRKHADVLTSDIEDIFRQAGLTTINGKKIKFSSDWYAYRKIGCGDSAVLSGVIFAGK